MVSNYPPGFGSARDFDHVEGPLSERERPGEKCGNGHAAVMELRWRSSPPQLAGWDCDWQEDLPEDDAYEGQMYDTLEERERERA
jgi:hypothetical protein